MQSVSAHVRGLLKNPAGVIAVGLLLALIAWRIGLMFLDVTYRDYTNQIWAASYQIVALLGVLCGLYYSRSWGGWKSVVGRANLAFALGLCAQLFGQSAFSYFFYMGIDVPYPSIADIGFFGSIPLYAYGAIMLIKAGGAKFSLKTIRSKLLAVLIPILMLSFSYFMFLRDYTFDWSSPLRVFLDFGYPLGQALYVSFAILGFILSRKMLGGAMRSPTLFFLSALVTQYIADYTFLYQSNAGTFVGGGIDDFIYLISYFLMTISLIQLGVIFNWIRTRD